MERFNRAKIILFLCGLCFLATAHGVSLDSLDKSCLLTYTERGLPAILHSPKCTQWVGLANSFKDHTGKCDLTTVQGRQEYQEDRMTCNLDLMMPVLGRDGTKDEAKVDVLAIFDGHGGAEASEMANQKLLDYFSIHVLFRAVNEAEFKIDHHTCNLARYYSLLGKFYRNCSPGMGLSVRVTDNESPHFNLKEALLDAIHDIDMEFWSKAYKKGYNGGSTATVVLLLNDEDILVVSLGDSPALLCKDWHIVEKLTRDHRPDEEDERARIEAAGGFVQVLGVPRVNGILAVSRAIGDISLKRFGVIAEPEVKGWRKLTRNDRYLVIASNGVFQGLSPEGVCKIIEQGGTSKSIVKAALKKGSMDNLSAIVLRLRQPRSRSSFRSQPSKDEL